MSKLLALLVRKIAEGDFGEPLKAAYWWLAGKKMYTGLAIGLAWAMLAWAQDVGVCTMRGWDCAGWSTTLASVAAFLVLVGLWDGALRSQPPNK